MSADRALLRAFGFTEELVSSNGHHTPTATCFGCGAEVNNKRQVLGTRSWCSNCRSAGKPGLQRVRDFRDRKSKERK